MRNTLNSIAKILQISVLYLTIHCINQYPTLVYFPPLKLLACLKTKAGPSMVGKLFYTTTFEICCFMLFMASYTLCISIFMKQSSYLYFCNTLYSRVQFHKGRLL